MKEYGVNEDILFHVDDLLYSNNIPKVARCLKEVAIIVSINKDNGQKSLAQTDSPILTHVCSRLCCIIQSTKLIILQLILFIQAQNDAPKSSQQDESFEK